jgi:hypothetical protein
MTFFFSFLFLALLHTPFLYFHPTFHQFLSLFMQGKGPRCYFHKLTSPQIADLRQVSFDLSFLAPFLSLELPFCFQS